MWIFKRLEFLYWDIYKKVKFGFQRMFRGYSNQDLYAFHYNWVERHYKMLKDFKKHSPKYPTNITEEEWDTILDEMIYHLEMMDEEKVTETLQRGMPKDWMPACNLVWEIMERNRKAFFVLFSEHFYDMWY